MFEKIRDTREAMLALVGYNEPFCVATMKGLPILDADIVESIVLMQCVESDCGIAFFPSQPPDRN